MRYFFTPTDTDIHPLSNTDPQSIIKMDTLQSPATDLLSLPSTPSSTTTTIRPRCEPDPLDPDANICLAKVTTDDRQGISHFFGRNKKATASIPEGMFPLLCRTHYQEKQYRWKEDLTAFAAFQCDCILKTLEKMARKTFVGPDGIEWPYWCGFELQTQRPSTGKDDVTIPDWLRSLCEKNTSSQTFSPIGNRDGVRYSFTQIETIVKAIKTWCLLEKTRLPPIEALPITIGMVDEVEVEDAKKYLKHTTREHTLASAEIQRSDQSRREITKTKRLQLQAILQQKLQAVNAAQASANVAQRDLAASKSTLPTKRQSKKDRAKIVDVGEKATSDIKTPSDPSPEPELSEMDSPLVPRRRIVLHYGRPTKRLKVEDD